MNPNQPTPPPPNQGNPWDFLQTPMEPQKPQSSWRQNKKFIYIVGGCIGLLLILTVVAALAPNDDSQQQSSDIPVASTSVPLAQYDGQEFSMSHSETLTKSVDEVLDENDPGSWFLLFTDDLEFPLYDVSISLSSEESPYVDGEDAINELLADGSTIVSTETKDVSIAGVDAKKTVAKVSNDFGESYQVYANTQVDGQYVTVQALYPIEATDIHDSFDAMIGSIKLK